MPSCNVIMRPNDYPTPPDEGDEGDMICSWCAAEYRIEIGCQCEDALVEEEANIPVKTTEKGGIK